MVQQLRAQGYRIKGIYIGTETPDINIERVAHRVRTLTGHDIDPERVRERHRRSLENLLRDAAAFDQLVLLDNSIHHEDRRPRPTTQGTREPRATAGRRRTRRDTWCRLWLEKLPRTARLHHTCPPVHNPISLLMCRRCRSDQTHVPCPSGRCRPTGWVSMWSSRDRPLRQELPYAPAARRGSCGQLRHPPIADHLGGHRATPAGAVVGARSRVHCGPPSLYIRT